MHACEPCPDTVCKPDTRRVKIIDFTHVLICYDKKAENDVPLALNSLRCVKFLYRATAVHFDPHINMQDLHADKFLSNYFDDSSDNPSKASATQMLSPS